MHCRDLPAVDLSLFPKNLSPASKRSQETISATGPVTADERQADKVADKKDLALEEEVERLIDALKDFDLEN